MNAMTFSAKDSLAVGPLQAADAARQAGANADLPPVNTGLVDTLFKLASGQTAADCAV